MSYFNQLHPWAIVRLMPKLQSIVVARFRRRPDAEAHLRILQQMIPAVSYQIIYDMQPEPTNEDSQIESSESTILPKNT